MSDSSPTGAPVVTLEMRGHVGIIYLQDHARLNALSAALILGVLNALEESRGKGARAVVIASASKHFCAGADISEMLHSRWLSAESSNPDAPTPLELFKAIETEPRVVIAAANGMVLGGGVELSLACDMLLAAEDATFTLPELGLGAIPNTAMARLPALVGARVAKELILTRRRITAAEALQLGLVNRVVAPAELLDQAIAMADSVVTGAPPGAITAAKSGMRPVMDWTQVTGMLKAMDTREWTEGFDAFLSKRKPSYERFWDARQTTPAGKP